MTSIIRAVALVPGWHDDDNTSKRHRNVAYNSLADFLLGLPNNGTGAAVAKPSQVTNPNSLRWTELAGYAQDQWTMTPKLTLNYGVRYENYPAIYRDRPGVARLDPTLPQTANVEIGGIRGNPKGAGYQRQPMTSRPASGLRIALTNRLVVRTGAGLTSDPDSMRYLRDAFPEDLAPSYSGPAADTIAVDPVSGGPLPLPVGIPAQTPPNLSTRLCLAAGQRRDEYVSGELPPRLHRELESVSSQQDLGIRTS